MFTIYLFPGCNQKLLHNTPLLSENTFNLTSQATTVKNGTVYSFEVGNDCRQLHSHVGCNIQSVSIFRFCCRIPWTSSLAQLICGRWKQSEHCTFRQLRIFLKKTAPKFNQRKLNESLFKLASDLVYWHVYVFGPAYFVWPWNSSEPYRTIRDVTPGSLSTTDTCIVYHVTHFEASRNVILHTRYVSTCVTAGCGRGRETMNKSYPLWRMLL
jgi:hypothetical protein